MEQKTEEMKFYTTKEVAEMFRFTIQSVHNWIKTGKVKAVKVGREYRIPQEEVDRIIK